MKGRCNRGCLLGMLTLCFNACPRVEYEFARSIAAPSGVVASAEGTTVRVSWQPVSGADTYTVYRSLDEHSYQVMATLSAASYFDTKLSPGTYYYKVSASNGEGELSSYTAVTVIGSSSGGEEPVPDNLFLGDSLAWISNHVVEGGSYTITLRNDETIAPQKLSYSGKTVSLTLTGGTLERTVNLSSNGSLFTVGSGVTLTLGTNLTLQGSVTNDAALIGVTGGNLIMQTGSKIQGNTSQFGGGIYVSSGIFTMQGGEIIGNTASSYGGGVYVSNEGAFTKQSGGTIYGSEASTLKNTATSGDDYGHAVYVGSSPAKKRNSTAGSGVTLDSTKDGAAGGWSDAAGGNSIPTTSLQAALTWLDTNAEEGGAYTITLNDNESIGPKALSYSGKNVSITLTGGSTERTVSLSSNGSLYTVGSGVTLTLDNNVSLQGLSNNTAGLVRVSSGGTLAMESGSKITGNTAAYYGSSSSGGGVYVDGGTFTMSGGEISDNTAAFGGGVYVSGGTFTMSGGAISGNTASSSGGGVYIGDGTFIKQSGGVIYGSDASSTLKNTAGGDAYGHAVYGGSSSMKRNSTAGEGVTMDSTKGGVAGGWSDAAGGNSMPTTSLQVALTWLDTNAEEGGAYTITLQNDETIAPQELSYSGKTVSLTLTGRTTERTVSLSSSGSLFSVGSGVTLRLDNNLTVQGRSNNTDPLVRVNSGGTLVMNTGSKVIGNESSSGGGGVHVEGGTFTMSGGTISGNTAFYGGGVYDVSDGTFTMSGGTISGNTAFSVGGGVFVDYGVTFTMSGGAISGNTDSLWAGGVYVGGSTFFTKQSGGTIYRSEASSTLKNTVGLGGGYGHAVYVYSGSKRRNTTAGSGVTLDSEVSGSVGGWE